MNQPIPITGGPEPIKRTAVEIRLNPLGWPKEADAGEYFIKPYNDAAGVAERAFSAFDAACKANQQNEGLTAIGQRQANHAWAEANLPELRETLAKIRERATETIENGNKAMTSAFTVPAEEPHDIALLQEVRTWIRTMPEHERTTKVMELARKGDRTALRAVLTAPAYLTGIDHDLLSQVRDVVAQADHPERFAKVQAVKAASIYAERALDGVIRYVEQESILMGRVPGASAA
jgi:hypothetical protein